MKIGTSFCISEGFGSVEKLDIFREYFNLEELCISRVSQETIFYFPFAA